MKKILIILLGLAISTGVFADVPLEETGNDFSYLFHLFYDNGNLYADRDFQFKYDIIAGPYTQPALTTDFPYRGEIINLVGEVGNHFVFDPKHGDVKFTAGKISVSAPYVADGEKAVFYNVQNQPLLTIFVSDSSFCNDDGICNDDRGESSLTCPKDCKQALPTPPVVIPPENSSGQPGILTSIIYIVLGIALVILAWWFFKRRNRGSGMTLPPTPPSSLPTPPAPPGPGNTV